MARYSQERKEAILNKLLPPNNMTVAEVSRLEGISSKTLYHWRDKLRKEGRSVPGKTLTTDDWSAEAKLAVIIETAVCITVAGGASGCGQHQQAIQVAVGMHGRQVQCVAGCFALGPQSFPAAAPEGHAACV